MGIADKSLRRRCGRTQPGHYLPLQTGIIGTNDIRDHQRYHLHLRHRSIEHHRHQWMGQGHSGRSGPAICDFCRCHQRGHHRQHRHDRVEHARQNGREWGNRGARGNRADGRGWLRRGEHLHLDSLRQQLYRHLWVYDRIMVRANVYRPRQQSGHGHGKHQPGALYLVSH